MPIYEYICMQCSEKFSLLQSVHASESDTACPKCFSKRAKKVLSTFSCSSGSGTGFSPSAPAGGFGGGG